MLAPSRPKRPVSRVFAAGTCLILNLLTTAPLKAESFRIQFKPSGSDACAVQCPGNDTIVSVFTHSGKLEGALWIDPQFEKNLVLIGHDRITRLCFFKNPRPPSGPRRVWKQFYAGQNPQRLTALSPDNAQNCQFQTWINQINDKVLPLALMKVEFSGKIPMAGTPLVDSDDQIVGLVLQPATGNTAYVIPSQAVHRVHRDINDHRKLVRGWLGISLSTNSNIPRITRVWPDSPAAKADLRPNDILIKAGPFRTRNYPEAVNALFYTQPGEPTSIEIRRSDQTIPCKIIPIAQKPGT